MKVGARMECAGLSVTIPVGPAGRNRPCEKQSVAIVETAADGSEEDNDDFLRAELVDLGRVKGASMVEVHNITKNPKMQNELLQNGCIEPSKKPYHQY